MDIEVKAGDITKTKADAIMLGLFDGEKRPDGELAAVDKALDGAISRLMAQGEIKGKLNEVTIIHSLGKLPAARVAVVGLGKKAELSQDKVRMAIGGACRLLPPKGIGTAATVVLGSGVAGIDPAKAAQALTEGAFLGVYSFRKHMTKEAEHGELKHLTLVAADNSRIKALQGGIDKGVVLAEATKLARDLVNEPANYMTPSHMAETAISLAKASGLKVEILEREQMQKLGMGALLGVTQGSRQPAKLIVLSYRGGAAQLDLALVGKGITFDAGGISIKPSSGMEEMKTDMAGAAAVIAAVSAIAQLKPRVNVVAIAPCAENLPSGEALKPGDVLTAMNGKTIEIISTDAEGRLVLADALGYANKLGAKRIVDVATLTGSMRAALGDLYSGAFGNNQELLDRVKAAGTEAGELVWQMPMPEEYKEQIKSDVADIKNIGGKYAGSITAAQFLAEFAGDTPWVHLDIAGTSISEKDRGYITKGATGVAVRTLANLALSLAK